MRPFVVIAAALVVATQLSLPAPAAASELAVKVAVVVGPVGEELTPVYIDLAEAAAQAAEVGGATVARAYSPEADADRVLAAVENANIVVYFGHGVGSPNPYTDSPNPATTNGWGLNGPGSVGTHADASADETLTYYGEAWLAANARPAPGFVMIYSNACYAPGAGEGSDEPATEDVAAARVSAYSRGPLADLGASAYFATDFYEGAAHLVTALLERPDAPYAEIFSAEPQFNADAVVRLSHPALGGAEAWLHRSPYFEGKEDYWYAFAGDPQATFAGGWVAGVGLPAGDAAAGPAVPPLVPVDGLVTGLASSYPVSAGWEGQATVALPLVLGGEIPSGDPRTVLVCADRCISMPVVDSCPCYVGTKDQRIANLSHEAWRQVTDAPLAEGLIDVTVVLSPLAPTNWTGAPTS